MYEYDDEYEDEVFVNAQDKIDNTARTISDTSEDIGDIDDIVFDIDEDELSQYDDDDDMDDIGDKNKVQRRGIINSSEIKVQLGIGMCDKDESVEVEHDEEIDEDTDNEEYIENELYQREYKDVSEEVCDRTLELERRLEELEKKGLAEQKDKLHTLEEKVLHIENKSNEQVIEAEIKDESREEPKEANIDIYATMDIESLYEEVKQFMLDNGVSKRAVDRKLLENKFGVSRIRELILKSYLILVGKGLTIGK